MQCFLLLSVITSDPYLIIFTFPFSQVLGAKKKSLAGMYTATAQVHQGFIIQCPIIQQTPPALRLKAMRLVASKCTLLARVDAFGQDPLVSPWEKGLRGFVDTAFSFHAKLSGQNDLDT